MSIFADDTLTQGQRLVWFAVRDLASDGKAPDNCSHIAGHMDSARAHVSRALRALEDAGWLTRENGLLTLHETPKDQGESTVDRDSQARDRDSQSRDSQSRKGFPAPPFVFPQESTFNPLSPSHLTPSQQGGDADATPTWGRRWAKEHAWGAEPLPDDHPAQWDYHPGDWRWEAGNYVLGKLQTHDLLNTHYRRRLSGSVEGRPDWREGKIASEWADTFRLLVEQDGWQREEVAITMQWLFETDNWWRKNRVVQSAAALRKTDDDGTTKFDKILQSALADYEQQKRKQTDPDAIREGFQADDERDPEPAGSPGDALPREPEVAPGDFVW